MRTKYKLTRNNEIFEGNLENVEKFLKHRNQVIYRVYNSGKTINGWKIEIEKQMYELYINKELVDSDTSIVRLLRRNNRHYNSHKKYIGHEINGIEIKVSKVLKEMGIKK